MDEFIHGPKPYLLMSATYGEILSWMIMFWMKNHLISDSNCNIENPYSQKQFTRMTNNVGLTFSGGDTIPQFTISIKQDN